MSSLLQRSLYNLLIIFTKWRTMIVRKSSRNYFLIISSVTVVWKRSQVYPTSFTSNIRWAADYKIFSSQNWQNEDEQVKEKLVLTPNCTSFNPQKWQILYREIVHARHFLLCLAASYFWFYQRNLKSSSSSCQSRIQVTIIFTDRMKEETVNSYN